jgi:thymidylate synthase (FAD)
MKNKVELLGYYGSDIAHAQSAWVSTSRELTEDKLQRIDKLLNMLASQGHHTPFEKSSLHFLVTTDIATHIQVLKHRIGISINAESARYKELQENKYYIPNDWHTIEVKSNLLDFNYCKEEGDKWADILEEYTKLGNFLYHKSLGELTPILGRKRAKESARFFKTYNSQITYDVMFNFRSFVHFLGLRNSEHAQVEIRDIAINMLELIKNIEGNPFNHTLKAFKL